ncbi:hypothetical protein CH253_07975 [Rhodococcus sp. 06-156-3C]|uniref:hypothetical protein n=1 Tax=Rhodococcus sp. 06-156-3C TaxID=2022486 RepID=UPI000B9BB90A|nr:hypothetical protein [Rhodococcus sp. 06-156-3C]OZD23790.1 hypothetical protein CH253_07975 [Rhodococcus sp. 06-156-3C]
MGNALTLVKVENREGDGRCAECEREGLTWVAILSDGSGVGLECSKRVLGFRPVAKSYAWVADFEAVAEFSEYGDTFVLWQHRSGSETRETRNGALVAVGGVRGAWQRKGWL